MLIISIQETIAQFKIDTEFRPRFEIRDGARNINPEDAIPAIFISQRTRLGFHYENDFLKFRFTPQDVRVWGDEEISSSTGIFADSSSLDLLETYVEIRLNDFGWLSVGRQQFKYDNQRLLGIRNWNQHGIAYDAAVLKLKIQNTNLHIGSTYNSLKESAANNHYLSDRIKNLHFLWINRYLSQSLQASLLHISSGVTASNTTNNLNYMHTTGIYSRYKSGNMDLWGNFYWQYGNNPADDQVEAYLIDIEGSYKLNPFTLGAGFSQLSGNDDDAIKNGTDKVFTPLYGNRHSFNGRMDYFISYEKHTGFGGLNDLYFFLKFNQNRKISVNNTFHLFSLAQTNELLPEDKHLAYENDFMIKVALNNIGTIDIGYLVLKPSETLQKLREVDNSALQQFFYVQLTVKGILFQN